MKICFYLAHPAHFHLFKNVIKNLQINHQLLIVYNDKDILDHLVQKEVSINAIKIFTNQGGNNFIGLLWQFLQKNIGTYKVLKKFKPDLVLGTPIVVSLIGALLNYKSIIVNEDDFDVVSLTANFGYPFADNIVCPEVCRQGKFKDKCITYSGYHELAYLHPDNFEPNKKFVEKYIDTSKPYFLIRFAKLTAHHDTNIRGLSNDLAIKLISKLEKYGTVYITSERSLEKDLEKYRISIDPIDIHHVIAFSTLYIGDSQTMAAEAGVLGTPFIRYNDFSGRISYLDELENKYQLGYSLSPDYPNELLEKVDEILQIPNYQQVQTDRRNLMLSEKINVATFLTDLIENYSKTLKKN